MAPRPAHERHAAASLREAPEWTAANELYFRTRPFTALANAS
jgi:hypothetical protein